MRAIAAAAGTMPARGPGGVQAAVLSREGRTGSSKSPGRSPGKGPGAENIDENGAAMRLQKIAVKR